MELCQEALALITEHLSEADNMLLEFLPEDEEIEKVVFSFPLEKSPGLDGVTIEIMIRKGWEYMNQSCAMMVRAFWGDGLMTSRAAARVIKLIPKNSETQKLTSNWCPLTMLTMTKKIHC